MGREKAYRPVEESPPAAVQERYQAFVDDVERRILDPEVDNNDLCRDVLAELYFARPWEDLAGGEAPLSREVTLLSLDPRNVTLESEYYVDLDAERFYPLKPLIWLWIQFDRSPVGHNVHLGLLFRRMLARHCFKRVGKNVKIFRNVEFSYGYNMELGDDVVLHHHVFLDDRGGIEIGDRASLSDYANVYSHSHDVDDIFDITLEKTVIGADVRLTYHSVVLTGARLEHGALLASMGVASPREFPPYAIIGGIPAKPIAVKPGAPPEAKQRFEDWRAALSKKRQKPGDSA